MNASVRIGELSVRMVVPMDMKKLGTSVSHCLFTLLGSCGRCAIPKCCRRAHHVLTQSAEHTIWSRTESDDVGRAEDEADDETDSYSRGQYM